MSEEKTGIVKSAETRLPKFVEDAYESIEKMEQFANILLKSKLVPHHFYEQTPEKKPDFTKGKVEAVVAVLIQGFQLQLPPLTALQHIIPVNGLLSIKGDLAKSMILNSGKLKTDTWKEEEFGSIESEDYIVKISASRSDNGQSLTRSFSVAQAKRAGLWVTSQQVSGADGWKYKASAWYKFPSRMINYRALGFLARDLFPDVMAGIYTTEEAADIPTDQTVVIDQGGGVTLQIPDKEFAKDRDKKITERAVTKIKSEAFAPIKEPEKKVTIASVDSPFVPQRGSVEYLDGKIVNREREIEEDQNELTPLEWSLEAMAKLQTETLLEKINSVSEMAEATLIIPGKNTNKKLREIIHAYDTGTLSELIAPYQVSEVTEVDFEEDPPEETLPEIDEEKLAEEMKLFDNPANSDISPNKEFDKPKTLAEELLTPSSVDMNKYKMEIPAFNKGEERGFDVVKQMFYLFNNITPKLDNERYLVLRTQFPEFEKFKNKEDFLKYATIPEVCSLLNKN